jgi:hypothetical protein
MKTFAKHLSHFMVLFGILLAGFAGMILFSYDKNFQEAIAIATASSYASWGIVHHYLHNDLHFEVIIEYIVVALFGLIVLFSLILV